MILVLPWAQHLQIFNSRQIKNLSITSVKIRHIVADKGKGWISQNGWHKKAKHVKFSGKWTFLASSYAHVRAHFKGLEMFVFRRIWRALFSCNTGFVIRLLPYCQRYNCICISHTNKKEIDFNDHKLNVKGIPFTCMEQTKNDQQSRASVFFYPSSVRLSSMSLLFNLSLCLFFMCHVRLNINILESIFLTCHVMKFPKTLFTDFSLHDLTRLDKGIDMLALCPI